MPHPDAWQRQRGAWLFQIGRRLQAEYEATEAPVPPRLMQLVKQFEMDVTGFGGDQPDRSPPRSRARLARR